MSSKWPRNKFRDNQGSLLVEGLLAIMILSVSLALIIQAMTASLKGIHRGQAYAQAELLLENQMASVLADGAVAEDKNEQQVFPAPYSDYEYVLTAHTPDDDAARGLNIVSVKVAWKGRFPGAVFVETYLPAKE